MFIRPSLELSIVAVKARTRLKDRQASRPGTVIQTVDTASRRFFGHRGIQ
jgi:hypothetical protein